MSASRTPLALFGDLAPPKSSSDFAFTTTPLPDAPGARLGRSRLGPAVLLEVRSGSAGSPPIELKNLTVRFNAACRIHEDGVVHDGTFTVVACTTTEPDLHRVFLEAVQILLGSFSGADTEVASAVHSLVELFRSLTNAPIGGTVGVWGELFVIAQSSNPGTLLASWHDATGDHFDFARADERVEVKTTIGRREHRFRLEQLQPPAGARLWIASIVTESSAAGSTVMELVEQIRHQVADGELSAKLVSVVAQALGSDARDWSRVRYDPARAFDSLRFFEADLVPRPEVPEERVWDVNFAASLEGIDPRGDEFSPQSLRAAMEPAV